MKKNTIKNAILLALENLKQPSNHWSVLKQIQEGKYFDFGDSRTPESTVSAGLGDLVRAGDSRINRVRQPNGTYLYYLTTWDVSIEQLPTGNVPTTVTPKEKPKSYHERDLHRLLSTYLRSTGVLSKTIYHEKSTNSDDNNQKWIHPDMVGAQFFKSKSPATISVLRAFNREEALRLSSYEIKREINTDYELKKAFFQTVSNSSWANYAFLVAFEFGENLKDEMERLNQSFGIGMIELNANPFQSKVLFPARYRHLDFKTLDKLSSVSSDFALFMEHSGKLLAAEISYQKALEREMSESCDPFFKDEEEAIVYCKEKNIPTENAN